MRQAKKTHRAREYERDTGRCRRRQAEEGQRDRVGGARMTRTQRGRGRGLGGGTLFLRPQVLYPVATGRIRPNRRGEAAREAGHTSAPRAPRASRSGAFGTRVHLPLTSRVRASHWRDCHFADGPSPSILKHLLKVEGGAAE